MISIKFGAKIPLELTLNTEETDKYILASLINLQTGGLIQENIILTHLLNGTYSNFEVSMPSISFVKVVAFVFENDEVTPSYTTPQKYEDVFALDLSSCNSNKLVGKIYKNPFVGKLNNVNKLSGKITELEKFVGKISDSKLTGKIKHIEKLIGKFASELNHVLRR